MCFGRLQKKLGYKLHVEHTLTGGAVLPRFTLLLLAGKHHILETFQRKRGKAAE
jgi:hypothetical protein